MGPGGFATENYFSQTSRLILIIITSLGLNIFSHEKSAFWLIGSQEHSMLKHEKSLPFLSNGADEIFTRITHFCRKWNYRWRNGYYRIKKSPILRDFFILPNLILRIFLCVSQYFSFSNRETTKSSVCEKSAAKLEMAKFGSLR